MLEITTLFLGIIYVSGGGIVGLYRLLRLYHAWDDLRKRETDFTGKR